MLQKTGSTARHSYNTSCRVNEHGYMNLTVLSWKIIVKRTKIITLCHEDMKKPSFEALHHSVKWPLAPTYGILTGASGE